MWSNANRLWLAALLLCAANIANAQAVGFTNWNGNGGSVTTVSTTSGTTQTSGSTFIAEVVNSPASVSVPTVTDNKGNTWTLAQAVETYPGSPRRLAAYYCVGCAGGSGHIVTATWTGTSPGSIGLVEFTGMGGSSSIGATPAGVNSQSGNSIAAPSITTSSANELVVNFFGTYGSNTQTLTDSGSPWSVAVSQQTSSYHNGAISWRVVTSSGTATNDTFTDTTFDYMAALSLSVKQTASSSCTHNFWKSTGTFAQPDGSTGSYWNLATGAFSTPNCSTGTFWRSDGASAAN